MTLNFLKDKSLLCLSKVEYITVLAPATGVVLAISVKAIRKYRQHQNRFNNKIFKFKKPIKTPVYNPIRDGLTKLAILKTSYVHGKIILICSKLNRIIFVILQKSPIELEFWTEGIWKATDVVIVCRAGRILFDTGKYLLKNKTNLLKTGINTLIWIVNDEAKALVYKLVFLGVSLSTAILWTYVPRLRRILRVWTTITIFNLCSNIVVTDGREMWLEHGPQVTAFGLNRLPIERIEHPIPELKTNPEELQSPRVILPGNETELRFSSPIRKKIKSTTFKDVTREHSEVSQNSILSEEATIVPTEKEKTKIRLKEETSLIIYEEKAIVVNKETTIATNEESPIVANEESPIIANEESPIVTNEETIIGTNEETTIGTNDETTIGTNEETIIVPKEELRKTNSTSKIKRTIQKSRTNNLQKLNEKFNPSGDDDDDPTSSNHNDNVKDGMNYTKVKAGKVR